MSKKFTKKDIEKVIPHRGVMLLLDEATEITKTSGRAVHFVRDDEFWCAGHFPGNPVMPGVIQVEALAQTACLVALNAMMEKFPNQRGAGYFTKIENCKFTKLVCPGDVLELEVNLIMNKLTLYKFHGCARVNGETVSEATFSAIMQFGA
ncbi:MAG: 3-hydroxyacyl-ACP dehydratase FabZ [Rickettsiales bacterium]|jgi:3-hydroxymyristoyl/3-hydroxydecanoyl-(acyl carrier protein) dehydratase|nr:3-hydroxyacyl-ACP dehydratase FabZ [Rickettsiales bacterium]